MFSVISENAPGQLGPFGELREVYAMGDDDLVVLPKRAFFCLLCGNRKWHLGGYLCAHCLRESRREIHYAIAMAKAGPGGFVHR